MSGYAFALFSTTVAYAVTRAFWSTFEHTSWGLFYLAIFASGWFGGLGPSVVSMALGAVLATSLDGRGFRVPGEPVFLARILVYVAVSCAISAITIESSNAEGSAALRVRVSDTGVGIDPARLTQLLRPFEQPGARPGQPGAGLGLGLSITDSLVRAHGGTLIPFSHGPGRGATFTVELATISPPARPTPVGERQTRRAGESGSKRILLVEDHEETLRAASDILEEGAYLVRTAATVEEALAAAERERFDLVISDIGLPDGSGLALMRRLRDEHGVRGIAIKGYGMRDDLENSKAAGFLEHLVKPVTAQKLESAVERALRTARSPDAG